MAGAGTISVDGGLRLVAVSEGDLEDEDVAEAGPDGTSGDEALALANEQVEELSQEKIELEDRLSEAETIIEDLRRLVELKDDELAALQAREISEQADPGPGLAERVGEVYDSATEALSGEKVKSIYDGVKDNWQLALALLAALLALAGWLLLRRNPARARRGLAAPAASVRPDFAKVVRDEKTAAPDDNDIQEAGAGAGELERADDMEETGPGAVDEVEAGEENISDEIEDEEDKVQNKLDLARAYLELGDAENVRSILDEVLADGNAAQKEEARQLLAQIDSL